MQDADPIVPAERDGGVPRGPGGPPHQCGGEGASDGKKPPKRRLQPGLAAPLDYWVAMAMVTLSVVRTPAASICNDTTPALTEGTTTFN